MATNNATYNLGLITPARKAVTVTPHDTDRLPFTTVNLHINVGGTIKYQTVEDYVVTQTVPDNWELPLQIIRVFATGTTASNITAYG